jgi:succinate dehydrogenase / fumarate reductase cytochrome b subunit
MSSVVAQSGPARTAALYKSIVGKKILMGVTGIILCGFVLGHMVGNLQIFLGPEKINAYGRFLHENLELLWPVRIILTASVLLHILAAWQVTVLNNFQARPVAYVKKTALTSSYAARTMVWSGPIIAAFVIYHLLHFTFGSVHPSFIEGDVYHNVTAGFSVPIVSAFYIVANILLAMHLYHGAWSMFQSLGLNHPRYTPWLKAGAKLFGIVIGIGNCSIPLAVLAGILPGSRTL